MESTTSEKLVACSKVVMCRYTDEDVMVGVESKGWYSTRPVCRCVCVCVCGCVCGCVGE